MRNVSYVVNTVLTSMLGVFGIRLEEEPEYRVVTREGDREIRRYAPYLMATTRSAGNFESSQGAMFRRLAAYIFGRNQKREVVEMTVPVLSNPELIPMSAPVVMSQDGEGWSMAFVLPSRFTRETVPVPTDPRVTISERPAEEVAVIRFSGSASEDRVEREASRLLAWIGERTDYRVTGPFRYAGYDPPFSVPFLRRHEVMVPVVAFAQESQGVQKPIGQARRTGAR